MALEFENHILTGTIGGPNDGLFQLKHYPVTGPNGEWLVSVDPIHGPPQKEGVDWGLTGVNYDYITYNLEGSSIRRVREVNINEGIWFEGPFVRVIYEY